MREGATDGNATPGTANVDELPASAPVAPRYGGGQAVGVSARARTVRIAVFESEMVIETVCPAEAKRPIPAIPAVVRAREHDGEAAAPLDGNIGFDMKRVPVDHVYRVAVGDGAGCEAETLQGVDGQRRVERNVVRGCV